MKAKSKSILKTAFAVFFSLFIFSAFIYGYLYIDMKSQQLGADTKDYSVPYQAPAPQNTGLKFTLGEGSTLVYLNFDKSSIELLKLTGEASPQDYGFPNDYDIKAGFDTVKIAVDMVGGIDLTRNGETLRFTGVQVVELLSVAVDSDELMREIFLGIFAGISKNGILREDLIELFESTQSDLTVPDYYKWADYLKGMSGRVSYVN